MVAIRVDGTVDASDAEELWPVYESVFGDFPDAGSWREAMWDRHSSRDGFRLARAHADGGVLVGFAYGYTGEHGQWWTDRVAEVLDPQVADDWLGGHSELVSIGVEGGARGSGTGRRLLRSLLADLPHPRVLLMTSGDPADPARRLYAAEGWQEIGPGIGRGTVVLGRRLAD